MPTLPAEPTAQEIRSLIGEKDFGYWNALRAEIDRLYDMNHQWNDGGKKWVYEYKYRRGGKTLCAFYAKRDAMGFMLIFGSKERDKIATIRSELSERALNTYDAAPTYHDGKWVMFDAQTDIGDLKLLLAVKRKPNR